jgi:hypothetical protein
LLVEVCLAADVEMRASFSLENDPPGPCAFASVKSLLGENQT